MNVSVATIGQNKNCKRVWLEGRLVADAGFNPKTRYQVTTARGTLVLTKVDAGVRIVSSRKRGEREIPIIDINSQQLLQLFDGMDQVKVVYTPGAITIMPLSSVLRAKERVQRTQQRVAAGQSLAVGSLASGGGVLAHALHAGLKKGGLRSELAFANELRPDLVEQALAVNPVWTRNTMTLQAPLQELAFDPDTLALLPQVDILEAGLPCSGASMAGRVKRGLSHPEAHPEVGHLVVGFLAILARVNPTVVVLENVPQYATSASMSLIRNQLRDLHYIVHETVLAAEDWNALEHRKRLVMVAVTRGLDFDFSRLVKPRKKTRTLAEILEKLPDNDSLWREMPGLRAKERRDAAAGKSFAMQVFTPAHTKIGTLTKGLQRNRSTDPKIQHPTQPQLLRLPTPVEHARAKDIPIQLIAGLPATRAHELLGQSISYKPFMALGQAIARTLQQPDLMADLSSRRLAYAA